MTNAKDYRDVPSKGIEVQPGIVHHPKSPNASLERLMELSGSIKLTEPIPRHLLEAWMNGEDEECTERAGS